MKAVAYLLCHSMTLRLLVDGMNQEATDTFEKTLFKVACLPIQHPDTIPRRLPPSVASDGWVLVCSLTDRFGGKMNF